MYNSNNGVPKISMAAARVNAGLTQRAAAEKLKINPDTLRNYEQGKTVPSWDTVKLLEQVYGFPMDYIFLPTPSL